MTDQRIHLLTLEWSDSPCHSGKYRIYLGYCKKAGRWKLSASANPFTKRWPCRKGRPDEDVRTVAVELLKKAVQGEKLQFDLICDNGPFDIDLSDFGEPVEEYVNLPEPIDPPEKNCRYCRHLTRPSGYIGWMAKAYDCNRRRWNDAVRNRQPNGSLNPNLDFSCDEFLPEFETKKITRYYI